MLAVLSLENLSKYALISSSTIAASSVANLLTNLYALRISSVGSSTHTVSLNPLSERALDTLPPKSCASSFVSNMKSSSSRLNLLKYSVISSFVFSSISLGNAENFPVYCSRRFLSSRTDFLNSSFSRTLVCMPL